MKIVRCTFMSQPLIFSFSRNLIPPSVKLDEMLIKSARIDKEAYS